MTAHFINIAAPLTVKAAILITVGLSFSAPALSTSGGLNSAGCHNSKTAGYHCHRAQQKIGPSAAAKPAQKPASK